MTSLVWPSNTTISKSDQIILWLSRHWILVFGVLFGLYVLMPFVAPALMAIGLSKFGKAIYFVYSFLCHQLPERSYFLFGQKISYTLPEIQSVWKNTNNIVILRQFIGNTHMGWKVAWSDRMVSLYTSIWLFGMAWGIKKNKHKPIPWWGLVLLILPMAIDGTTHMVSDFAGIGKGFRDTNVWLANLTNYKLPFDFYAGDAWGSFNAWMRLITGVLFGLGMVGFGFPYLNESFIYSSKSITYKLQHRTLLEKEKERLRKLAASKVDYHKESFDINEFEIEGKNEKNQ
ncbi:MAG: hypothetical protein CL609_15430 [Anaerolineaceae bacterium]|nr:hypothetical protein [Anaerolineaceae bacterium]